MGTRVKVQLDMDEIHQAMRDYVLRVYGDFHNGAALDPIGELHIPGMDDPVEGITYSISYSSVMNQDLAELGDNPPIYSGPPPSEPMRVSFNPLSSSVRDDQDESP